MCPSQPRHLTNRCSGRGRIKCSAAGECALCTYGRCAPACWKRGVPPLNSVVRRHSSRVARIHMTILQCFRMPRPVRIAGRTSTITNSFVNGIIPCRDPTEDEIREVLNILELDPDDLRCAYCGDPSTEWDHLRPIVRGQRPTGYISEIANLVPACGKCNQSKSGSPWREWISGSAPRSPTRRGVPNLQARIARLERFEKWRAPTVFDFESVVGSELWSQHWNNWEQLIALMKECDAVAENIRRAIAGAA